MVHVKISFRVRNLLPPRQHHVVRVGKYKIFVYPNGVINVTGVGSFDEIEAAIAQVVKHFKRRLTEVCTIKIDNVTYTNSFCRKLNLDEVYQKSKAWMVKSRYNPTIFPGE